MAPNSAKSGLYKFQALLYKSHLQRKRHFITTICEILLPILISCIPVIIQMQSGGTESGRTYWINHTVHAPFDPFAKVSTFRDYILFAYAPSNNHTDVLMENSIQLWTSHYKATKTGTVSLKNGEELESYCARKQQENQTLLIIGTVFNSIPSAGKNLPSNLDYTIRYSNTYVYPFAINLKYRFSAMTQTYTSATFFLSWQAAVEKTFIQEKMREQGTVLDYDLWMQKFPYPSYKGIRKGYSLAILIPVVISYSLIIFGAVMMRRVIEEKADGCKELLKMMGMTDFIYWSSTFVSYYIFLIIIILTVTIAYTCTPFFLEYSSFSLLLVLFLLHAASFTLFCLAVSTFFSKATFGIVVFVIAYNVSFSLLSSFIFVDDVLEIAYYPLSQFVKFCICLLPPGSILTMTEIILVYEASGEGVRWSNLYSYDAIPDFSVSWLIFAMYFSCILYGVLIWYVDGVWPWQYGIPKPWYFPFMKSYWMGYIVKNADDVLIDSNEEPKNSEFFEDDPSGISPGVIIRNLVKVFRSGLHTKTAVNNISLNIYNGQITALLGHNGAGKTTTLNILTGLYTPSSGSASVNGYDISSETIQARESLGVCPQQNILYDTLTVEEHLKIYATLKGVTRNKLNQETVDVLKLLNLFDERAVSAKHLSGGMKRKLCLGIAVIGGSKVLFLDEPTSGMDVEARRNVWDTLLNIRQNHTIVLTTHYMEEADILGDRIAIMADGEIQCCGSPLFLKTKFGTGYHLHLVKNENFDMNAVKDLVMRSVPDATLENDFEGEATFNLMANNQSNFGSMFEEIELKKESLGINSCGVTVTTMDDVFLNIATLRKVKQTTGDKYSLEDVDETEIKDLYVESAEFGKPVDFKWQFYGLFLKRFHYAKRHWSVLILQFVIPLIVISFCLHNLSPGLFKNSSNEPGMKLDIEEVYGETDGFLHSNDLSSSHPITAATKNLFNEKNIKVVDTDAPVEFVLKYAQSSLADYYKKLLVGASIQKVGDKLNLTAWFNGFPYHAEPMSLLLMDTAILRTVAQSGSITLRSDPLPDTHPYYYEDPFYTKERYFAIMYITLALSFLSASFVLVPIHERTSKAKFLQLMTGISPATYWLSMFAWDLLLNTVISILFILPLAFFSHYVFFSPHSEAIGTAILLMILYGWASIPFAYIFSLVFTKPNNGYSVITSINIVIGVAVCSIFTALLRFTEAGSHPVMKALVWILQFIPCYPLSSGFSNLFAIAYSNAYCESLTPNDLKYNCFESDFYTPILKCCKDICGEKCLVKVDPLTMQDYACGRDLLFLYLDGVLYFLLLLLFELPFTKSITRRTFRRFSLLRRRITDNQPTDQTFLNDSDVVQEEERIKNSLEQAAHNDALVVHNLTKRFKNFKAVDGLTFGIHEKECFGLLGVNGAGKTTTFRMLIGDCYPTEGDAFINTYSVTEHLKKFQSYIGYCPQFDALIDRLSARELLTLFARLRGLTGTSMTRYVNALIKMTDLVPHADKPSMEYSGGNKRKLSIAVALIGAPPLLLLDEPTAGVDPVSRRKIWKILSLARSHSGAAVILTTHSMEECEALCTRLAIMVNGRFRCLGSIQHLKSKFGQGYTLIIKGKKGEQSIYDVMKGIKAFIDEKLPGAYLKDDHQRMLQYHVVDPAVTLSSLFRLMDDLKNDYDIEDYVISDTSLEQLFLVFARSQRFVAT